MATLSAPQVPSIDLPKLERPRFQLPETISNIDLEATVSGAAETVGLRRPARRSRWIVALGGLALAAAAGWGLLRSPQIRARSEQLMRSLRERITTMRPNAFDLDVGDPADPIAFPAAETKPIAPDRWNAAEDVATPDYPDGLGTDSGDESQAREESHSRA